MIDARSLSGTQKSALKTSLPILLAILSDMQREESLREAEGDDQFADIGRNVRAIATLAERLREAEAEINHQDKAEAYRKEQQDHQNGERPYRSG